VEVVDPDFGNVRQSLSVGYRVMASIGYSNIDVGIDSKKWWHSMYHSKRVRNDIAP
jgi:hypothetical protein